VHLLKDTLFWIAAFNNICYIKVIINVVWLSSFRKLTCLPLLNYQSASGQQKGLALASAVGFLAVKLKRVAGPHFATPATAYNVLSAVCLLLLPGRMWNFFVLYLTHGGKKTHWLRTTERKGEMNLEIDPIKVYKYIQYKLLSTHKPTTLESELSFRAWLCRL
jgi:hypothetical protein